MPKVNQPKHADGAPLIAAMIRKMGLDRHLDETLAWDQQRCVLSPGKRLIAFIINILLDRQPLYHVKHFYEHYDCELLFGHGVRAEQFTDDVLAHLLDLLYEVDLVALYGQLAFMVHQSIYGHNKLTDIHLDRTTISMYGAYDRPQADPEEINITYGASKDHRPDLKQFSAGLAVNSDGLPLLADVGDGNQAEAPWFRTFLPRFIELYGAEELSSLTSIADAAFVSTENLKTLHELGTHLSFISRLPGTFKEGTAVKERALKRRQDWEKLGKVAQNRYGATYQCGAEKVTLGGVDYRALVFSSSSLTKTKEHSLNRMWEKQRAALLTACKKATESLYGCEADAQKAAEELLARHARGVWTVSYTIHDTKEGIAYFHPTSKSQTVPTDKKRTIRLQFGVPVQDLAKVEKERELASLFVLVTNISEEQADAREILSRYKEQHRVETGFKFLKGPMTLGPIFLKKESRIEALSIVFLIAYLVGMSLQIRVRRGYKARQRPLDIGYRKTDAPTIKVILEVFDGMLVTKGRTGKRQVHLVRKAVAEVLEDCGLDLSCWTTVPPG